jgi:hypothetical protein
MIYLGHQIANAAASEFWHNTWRGIFRVVCVTSNLPNFPLCISEEADDVENSGWRAGKAGGGEGSGCGP